MKGRYCIALCIAGVALLSIPGPGSSQTAGNFRGLPTENKQVVGNLQQSADTNIEPIHVVRRGDTLTKISQVFDTTPEALKSLNGLKSSKIIVGQKLRISVPPKLSADAKISVETTMQASSEAPDLSSGVSVQQDQNEDTVVDAGSRRMRLIEAGFQLINVRYRFGGGSEKSGFDCSGLVKSLFSKFDIDLPHSSREQFKQGEKVERDRLEAGDLVFFSSGGKLPTHVGIYIGNDKFLHAARKAQKVIISDLNRFWYTMRYLGARRITDLWWEEPGSTAESN